MHYGYLLTSMRSAGERYVSATADLKRRLAEHNSGESLHTAKFKPWRLVTYVAFSDEQKAAEFERYLKSGSTPLRIDACGGRTEQRLPARQNDHGTDRSAHSSHCTIPARMSGRSIAANS